VFYLTVLFLPLIVFLLCFSSEATTNHSSEKRNVYAQHQFSEIPFINDAAFYFLKEKYTDFLISPRFI